MCFVVKFHLSFLSLHSCQINFSMCLVFCLFPEHVLGVAMLRRASPC